MSFRKSLGQGRSLVEALFLVLRYFTILTDIAVAILTVLTIVHRHRAACCLQVSRAQWASNLSRGTVVARRVFGRSG